MQSTSTPLHLPSRPRVKALTAELARANEQLVAYGGRLKREIERRKQAEEDLTERLRFELLLSDLSAWFINIDRDQVDSKIESALQQILEFFQVDRCALIRTLPGKTSYEITL